MTLCISTGRSRIIAVSLPGQGHIVELKYNGHLAAVFDLPEAVMHDYYLAYRALMQRTQSPQYAIRLKLQDILHGLLPETLFKYQQAALKLSAINITTA